MNAPLYHLQQVEKVYNGRTVLQIEELTVYPGEILALVGPSGVGKSTLLRLLNFLEPPSKGSITFRSQRFNGQQAAPLAERRRVTTVFQRPFLLNRSVKANVEYGLRLRHQRDTQAQVAEVLARVGLQDLAQQKARTLSGGEAQRVALARAMILQPDVLLLDEPTANLDPYNVGLIEDIVRQMNEAQNMTMLLVTHNVFQAKRLAHRVTLLLNGRVVETAPTETFFNNPRDPRTAAFVRGDMVY
ncbi:MAG TPA: ATP-binding cassette domain-containing protein [Anaerolineales bacterium]|nr:ATP-binding cassette domain-containing protein [Anaerolineales bacterium]